MVENQQQSDIAKPNRKKHILKTAGRVFDVLFTSIIILVFIKFILTGYLSRIGIAVGSSFVVLMVGPYILDLAGRKHLTKVYSRVLGGTIVIILLAMGAVLIWPEGNHTWKPYRFNDELAAIEAKRAVPDKNNAATYYKSVFSEKDVNDRPASSLRKNGLVRNEFTNYPWKGTDYPEVSQWLDSHSDTIDELLRIGKIDKCRWPFQVNIYDDYTVPYKSLCRCVDFLIAAGNRDLGEGRYHKALEKYFCLLRMAEHMYQQSLDLDFYFGMAYEKASLRMIRYVLIQSDLTDEDIGRITNHFPTAANNWQRDVSRLLEFEEFRFAYLMAQLYEINEKEQVRFSTSSLPYDNDRENQESLNRMDRLSRFYRLMNMPLNPRGVLDMAERESAKFARFLEQGPMLDINEDNEKSFIDLFNLFGNPDRWAVQGICFNKVLYKTFGRRYVLCMIQRRGTWLVFGLRRYRDVYSTWPDRLDQISEYVPTEAFIDPTGNDEFVYAIDGDGFSLYSKGINHIDEAGRYGYVRALDKNQDDIAIWLLPKRETGSIDND